MRVPQVFAVVLSTLLCGSLARAQGPAPTGDTIGVAVAIPSVYFPDLTAKATFMTAVEAACAAALGQPCAASISRCAGADRRSACPRRACRRRGCSA